MGNAFYTEQQTEEEFDWRAFNEEIDPNWRQFIEERRREQIEIYNIPPKYEDPPPKYFE